LSAVLGELDAYLKLKPYGAPSEEIRAIEKSIKERLANSTITIEAARTKP